MNPNALWFVTMTMALLGCPGPSGIKPLPEGPPPEYEKPRSYDPEGNNIDGTPPPLGSEAAPEAPAPVPPPAPALPEDDEPIVEPEAAPSPPAGSGAPAPAPPAVGPATVEPKP